MNWKGGLQRVGIVVAVLWFGYWSIRCFGGYQDWQREVANARKVPLDIFIDGAAHARDVFYGNVIAAFIFPAMTIAAFFVGRWIIRGFRAPQ